MQLTPHAHALFQDHVNAVHRRVDRLFALLLGVEWIAGVCVALWLTPLTWAGREAALHPHVLLAAVGGGVVASAPIALAILAPGKLTTRLVIAAAQLSFSALFIHLTGGRIETHFHVFGSLAFLAFYRDWRVFVPAVLVTVIDHSARGLLFPESVFGTSVADPWRWIEHAGWVLFEVGFLVASCRVSLDEMREIAAHRAALEHDHARVEREVVARTAGVVTANERAQDLASRAEAANEAKSRFLANMSHDLRTPMNAVVGAADLILHEPLSPSGRDLVEVMRKSGVAMVEVLNDLLDMAKIDAGHLAIDAAPFSPGQLLADVRSLFLPQLDARQVELIVDAADLPQRLVGDDRRLRQVLVNLVGNAVKFTARGTVRVACSLVDDDGAPRLAFSVRDTGVGIAPSAHAAIFEPFVQADSSTTRRYGGTGLGLAIARRLVEAMGGDLTVTSALGDGACFEFTVRVQAHAPVAPVVTAPPDAQRALEVLIAEDNEVNQMILSHMLARLGHRYDVVGTGRAALDAVASRHYDVVLMDVQMPEMDGLEATRRIRAEVTPQPIIIAVTANAMRHEREESLAAGVDMHISKPIRPDLLTKALARVTAARSDAPAPDDLAA